MNKLYLGIGGAIVAGLGSIIYACGVSGRTDKLIKRLNVATDELAEGMHIDISPSIIKEATDKAVAKAVNTEVDRTISWIKEDVDSKIKSEVKTAVNNIYPDIKEGARARLASELEHIDISSLKREVAEKAAERASEKFDAEFQSILDDYNSRLKNISDIYSSIADAITKK